MMPLLFDAVTEHLVDPVTFALEQLIGTENGDAFNKAAYEYCINVCQDIIMEYLDPEM